MFKEGDSAYEQQCDIILKPKHFQLQVLLVILDDTTFFCQIHEDLKKYPLVIVILNQLKSHQQVHVFFNDHVKFKFQDGLFCGDGLLYILDGPSRFQVF
jgi:hypothetical protein